MFSIFYIICFLLNSTFGNIVNLPLSGWDLIILSATRGNSLNRVRRQDPIVQPNWSFNSDVNLFEDYNVRVTEENLEETEAIREYIHETVENGTYVVELDEEDFENDEKNIDEETPTKVEDLAQPESELEMQVTPLNVPITTPAPILEPIPPTSKQSDTPEKIKPKLFKNFRIAPRRNSAFRSKPLFSWLRKGFKIREIK